VPVPEAAGATEVAVTEVWSVVTAATDETLTAAEDVAAGAVALAAVAVALPKPPAGTVMKTPLGEESELDAEADKGGL
jgi:hypothetical protein